MEEHLVKEIASELHLARLNAKPLKQYSEVHANMTEADAYRIQTQGIEERLREGEQIVGYKMGLTSEAKRKQMDLHSPLYGVLTDKMQVSSGGSYNVDPQIHPKIEPEIAFKLNRDIDRVLSKEEAWEAVGEVCSALEILDSRYQQFKYFSLEDVISDNSSSSHFILGPWINREELQTVNELKIEMSVDGTIMQTGTSDAISGDPIISLVQLTELFEKTGRTLKSGMVVLAGAATAAVALDRSMTVHLEVEGLPGCEVEVKKTPLDS